MKVIVLVLHFILFAINLEDVCGYSIYKVPYGAAVKSSTTALHLTDITVSSSTTGQRNKQVVSDEHFNIPTPLDKLVDVHIEKRSVIYELELGREIGFDIVQLMDFAAVGEVRGLSIYIP